MNDKDKIIKLLEEKVARSEMEVLQLRSQKVTYVPTVAPTVPWHDDWWKMPPTITCGGAT